MRAFSKLILFCAFVGTNAREGSAADVERQAKMTTCELVADMGYHCETRKATTEDGFVVEVDRVWEDASETQVNENYRGVPILLLPGMFYDSATWFINYPSQSAGFLLAHKGYDVWALNTREAVHRSYHKELNHSDPQYWQWSFDEVGRFDVAAAIDLALSTTGASNLALLGFSQGFTSSLVLLSTNPNYNAKVNLLMGYAPVANVSHTGYPASPLVLLSDLLLFLLDPLRKGGQLSFPGAPNFFCSILDGNLCSMSRIVTLTASPQQCNKTRTPVYNAHSSQGTSIQNLRHFAQVAKAEKFLKYDSGSAENLLKYGTENPPEYPVERISVPVALFSSTGDTVADPADVADLVQALGSTVALDYVVPIRNFRHTDFVLGYNAADVLHDVMIAILSNYTSRSN